jgi:hypothetical protein
MRWQLGLLGTVGLLVLAVGCPGDDDDSAAPGDDDDDGAPLGMILASDGVTYAGAAAIDVTPEVIETWTDLNDDGTFDGCLDDPAAAGEDCDEPFDDVDGDGWFDAVFIGGYGPMRPANGVHDPISVRAVVLSHDGEYLALVGMDLVGLAHKRIHEARDRLVADGFDGDRLLASSTHNHQGPDTMGLWGNPEDFANPVSGLIPEYQERVVDAIEQAVRDAASAMEPVTLTVGAVRMRDRDPYFNGSKFGGKNPTAKMHGMVHDIRDPVVVSDQLLVLQGVGGSGDAVFTWTNWSGHPEVWGDKNTLLSSDWVGVARTVLEAEYGGVAVHMPECLGGMQSAGGGDLPLVDENGVHVFQTCDEAAVADPDDAGCFGKQAGDTRTDTDGDPVPEWPEDETWEFTRSHGWHIAEAAMAALAAGEVVDASPLRVETEPLYVPVTNVGFQLLGGMGLFDLTFDDAVYDPELCPEASEVEMGCLELRTFRVQLGPVGLVTAPGELFPEIAWGLPADDSRWLDEVDDPTTRGPESAYFPQHDSDCNELEWSECTDTTEVGDCDCLAIHAWPYALNPDPTVAPLLDSLDTDYRAVLGMLDTYAGYIVPQPDFNTHISLLTEDGDHYEDTVSMSYLFGTKLQEGQARIDARW